MAAGKRLTNTTLDKGTVKRPRGIPFRRQSAPSMTNCWRATSSLESRHLSVSFCSSCLLAGRRSISAANSLGGWLSNGWRLLVEVCRAGASAPNRLFLPGHPLEHFECLLASGCTRANLSVQTNSMIRVSRALSLSLLAPVAVAICCPPSWRPATAGVWSATGGASGGRTKSKSNSHSCRASLPQPQSLLLGRASAQARQQALRVKGTRARKVGRPNTVSSSGSHKRAVAAKPYTACQLSLCELPVRSSRTAREAHF